MSSETQWKETADGFTRGNAKAQRFPDVNAFVILTFGEDATAESAFECIAEAMRFGQIAIHGDESNRILARELHHADRVKFAPFVGLPFDAFGVAAIKTE